MMIVKVMKPIFRTDLCLAVLGVGSLVTGLLIHYAGHFGSHIVWQNWSIAHIVINVALVATVAIHIKQHFGWFKQLLKKSSLKRKLAISVAIPFLVAILSGVFLLAFIYRQNSHLGIFHYYVGLAFAILSISHLVKRWKVFCKGIAR